MESGVGDRRRKPRQPPVRVESVPDAGPPATRRALARVDDARAIVLVEGLSDQIALETLATRRGRNLDSEGVLVVPIGGAQAIGRYLARFGPRGSDSRLAGLCDVGEEEVFKRNLERAGFGTHLTRLDMERLGFHVCVTDLEDELIRALGPVSVEAVLDAHGDLGAFRTFQMQPPWRGQGIEWQLRRFMGSADRRKLHYARFLVEALDLAQVPRPLDAVLGAC
jgi:Overcoming lysogenization defect protein-like, TOPRIM domain